MNWSENKYFYFYVDEELSSLNRRMEAVTDALTDHVDAGIFSMPNPTSGMYLMRPAIALR